MRSVTRRDMLVGASAASAAALLARREARASAATYANHVLAKQPAGYWQLNAPGANGLVPDASAHGHFGICHGLVAFDRAGAVGGDAGRAAGLDGETAYIEVADSTVFSQPSSGMGLTVEAWMRPNALRFAGQTSQHYVHWLGKGEAGAFEWGLRFYSADSPDRPNRISAYVWNPAAALGTANEGAGAYFQDELEPGSWIHVVACFDPGDARSLSAGVSIYKNGVFRAGPQGSRGARYASYGVRPRHASAPLRMGTRDRKSFFTGDLNHVAIYPRVLSAAEVMDNFSAAS